MRDVTDTKQKKDPWTDPDPQPEDFEEWLADPENEIEWQSFPGNPYARVEESARQHRVRIGLEPDRG
jgi:hypothetical protein